MNDPLKTLRHDLGELLGGELDIAVTPYGSNVNPPCVRVQPAGDYVVATGYCSDLVRFEAVILPGAGEGEATTDALDDLIDGIRAALDKPIRGRKFSFHNVTLLNGDTEFGAVAEITYERAD